MSDTTDKIYAAYTAAFAEIQNAQKNSTNPHFKNNYADLESVLATVRPVFARHGLAVMQAPGKLVRDGDSLHMSLTSVLVHQSGQHLAFETQLPVGKDVTAQKAGSAITYARRYALAAIAGITQTDDDANAASDGPGAVELLKRIEAATRDNIDALRKDVEELADNDVARAFVARRKELRK